MKNSVSRWFPGKVTIFHRVNKFNLKTLQFDKIKLLSKFKRLEEVEFYKIESPDSIGAMQAQFPNWQLESTNANKTKYRLLSSAETE